MKNRNMTCSETAKVIVYSSFMLYMLDNLLDAQEKAKGSTIRLKQVLRAKTVSEDHLEVAELSNKVWSQTIEKHKEENRKLLLGDFFDMVLLEEEKAFTKMYGDDIVQLIYRFALNMTEEGTPKEIVEDSRIVTKTLINLTRKHVFEYCKTH